MLLCLLYRSTAAYLPCELVVEAGGADAADGCVVVAICPAGVAALGAPAALPDVVDVPEAVAFEDGVVCACTDRLKARTAAVTRTSS